MYLTEILSLHKMWLNNDEGGKRADLRDADLRGADLRGADLRDADLRDADLCGADFNERTVSIQLQCPEEGSFIAYKKCVNDIIVKLFIPEDAKRSSATTRKCRASKAIVLEIYGADEAISQHDPTFIYKKGETLEIQNFNDNRWEECSAGIHFFLTRIEAEKY